MGAMGYQEGQDHQVHVWTFVQAFVRELCSCIEICLISYGVIILIDCFLGPVGDRGVDSYVPGEPGNIGPRGDPGFIGFPGGCHNLWSCVVFILFSDFLFLHLLGGIYLFHKVLKV